MIVTNSSTTNLMAQTDQTLTHLEALGARWLGEVLALMSAAARGTSPPSTSLTPMLEYHLGTGGKRLRALIPIAVAEALEIDPGRVLGLAAACEMLHNATLVHDDLQDGDTVRRGEPTVWAKFGEGRAINLGDAMLYWTLELAQHVDFDESARNRLVRRIVSDTLRVIDGQEREFALQEMERPTSVDYVRMAEGKTSGLFALPIAGTAELCGAPADVVAALTTTATHLGVLFQIQDDVLDLYGDKGRGRRGSDIGEGKISALVTHFLENGPEEEGVWLLELLRAPREESSRDEVERAAQLFRSHGSLKWVLEEIDRRRQLAVNDVVIARYPELANLIDGLAELFVAPIAEITEAV